MAENFVFDFNRRFSLDGAMDTRVFFGFPSEFKRINCSSVAAGGGVGKKWGRLWSSNRSHPLHTGCTVSVSSPVCRCDSPEWTSGPAATCRSFYGATKEFSPWTLTTFCCEKFFKKKTATTTHRSLRKSPTRKNWLEESTGKRWKQKHKRNGSSGFPIFGNFFLPLETVPRGMV